MIAKMLGKLEPDKSITALYELSITDVQNEESLAQFEFRYKKPGEDISRLLTMDISLKPIDITRSSEKHAVCSFNSRFRLIDETVAIQRHRQ